MCCRAKTLALIKPRFQPTLNSIAKNDCRIIRLHFNSCPYTSRRVSSFSLIKRCGRLMTAVSLAVRQFSKTYEATNGTAVASHCPEHQRLFLMHFQSWWGKGRGGCNFAATAVCSSCSSLGQLQLQFVTAGCSSLGQLQLQFAMHF